MLHLEDYFCKYDTCYVLKSKLGDTRIEGIFDNKHDAVRAYNAFKSDWHYEAHDFWITEERRYRGYDRRERG